MPTHYLTPDGLIKFKKELDMLKTVKRKEIAQRIERARDLGDLSENAEYHAAREDQSFMEGRVEELEYIIRNAALIEHHPQKHKGAVVGLGSTVKVSMGGKEAVFTIVGASEANPLQAKISNESPLGRTLLGGQVGAKLKYQAPKGVISFTILEVS